MADSAVTITPGSGINMDTRTESTNSNHRQVVVLGDPLLNNNVAAVATQDPGPTDQTTPGIVMRLAGSMSVTLAGASGSISTYISGTAGTIRTKLDPESVISGIQSTVGIYFNSSAGTINVQLKPGTIAVSLDPGHLLGSVTANAGTGTMTVTFDPGHELGSIRGNSNTLTVFLPDTGHEIGTIRGNTNTLTVFLPDTGHELGSIRSIATTVTVKPDPAGTYFTNGAQTASIFTVSGSTSGGTTSGVTLISPSANYNFKIFAYSLQTTATASSVWRFTDGGAASPVEKWRALVTAASTTSSPVGTNFATTPPGYIFATGTSTTLALKSDSGDLVHYSVSYIKESA